MRATTAEALSPGLESGQFRLHYQPIIDLRTGRLEGAEALMRWKRPGRSLLGPRAFIAAAEASGDIVPLGDWAIDQACATARRWPPPLMVAVNVSPVQLSDPLLPDRVSAALDRSGLAPNRLCLELTESACITRGAARSRLVQLRALGVQLAYDDLGTGFSTLSAVELFPEVDVLKIDRQFVAQLPGQAASEAIVRSTLVLARGIGARVVAEGVETASQLEAVRSLGCHLAQGFLFSKPIPSRRFEALVRRPPDWAPPCVKRTVLVADDDSGVRGVLSRVLTHSGFDVVEASDGKAVRAVLAERHIDLLTLDLGLPDGDGLELLRELRTRSDLPAIVVSGRAAESQRVAGLGSGADDYLVKPFSPQELVARAEALLRRTGPGVNLLA